MKYVCGRACVECDVNNFFFVFVSTERNITTVHLFFWIIRIIYLVISRSHIDLFFVFGFENGNQEIVL
jgi:hypothetical protein